MNQKGFAPIIVAISIALIIIAGVIGYFALKKSTISQPPLVQAQPFSPSSVTSTAATAPGVVDLQIIEPTQNQVFAPGATVNVAVQVSPALKGTGVIVGVSSIGLGPLQANYNGGLVYSTSFVIPENYAGSLTITPLAITGVENNTVSNVATGTSATILVQSGESPTSMRDVNGLYLLSSTSSVTELDILGYYPNNVQRDITASTTGTTYQSNDVAVVTVDSDGIVTPTGFGQTQVIARNGIASTSISFVIENPTEPLAAQNFTSDFSIQTSSWVYAYDASRQSSFYTQTVTVTNNSSVPVVGPLYLVLLSVSSQEMKMAEYDHLAVTSKSIQPLGTPYLRLPMPTTGDGLTYSPGQSVSVQLQLTYSVGYTPEIIRTTGNP